MGAPTVVENVVAVAGIAVVSVSVVDISLLEGNAICDRVIEGVPIVTVTRSVRDGKLEKTNLEEWLPPRNDS
jgi:hypothetical protein